MPLRYPDARVEDLVEDLHGTPVADPYRWLEDSASEEVAAWVEAQNSLTRSWLDAVPVRGAILERLRALWDYPKVGLPVRRGGHYFFQRNEGLQNQPVLHVQEGRDGSPRVLLDPNTLSDDGTVALTNLEITRDGGLLAYGLSESGSDWQEIRVRRVDDGEDLPDRIRWVRFSEIAWNADGTGFFYARYPEPGTVPEADADYFQRLHFHPLGSDPEADPRIYERPEDRLLGVSPTVTEDGRWLLIHVFRGTDKNNEVFFRRLDGSDGPIRPLMSGFDASYAFIDAVGDTLYFRTDRDAPRGSIIAVDLDHPEPASWRTVVPQSEDVLDFGAVVHGELVLAYLHRAHHRLLRAGLDGKPRGEISLPGIGSVTGLSGRPGHDELFFGYTSFVTPSTVYRFGFDDREPETFHAPELPADTAIFETRQVEYASADGTRIPMFLVHRRALVRDGSHPCRLYGYGGFNISITPAFNPSSLLWLERGGVLAFPSLRGGAEFGEEWHSAGMLERKQNVFDDFLGAAGWLIEEGYTRPDRLAMQGGSNGGLLTGACLVQRPDLFGAVVCQVPVLDMLRYHLWTIGRYWMPEYGDPDDPAMFPILLRYSPYHNLRAARYPALLVTTGDTDDRVHPAHARKFVARIQAVGAGGPALLRVETRAGHGAGKPTDKVLQEAADIHAFLHRALGLGA